MPRETFPFESDRAVIDDWLAGHKGRCNHGVDALLDIVDGKLMRSDWLVAEFDTGGSLVVSLLHGISAITATRVANYICEQLGLDGRITRDPQPDYGPTTWFYDGQPIIPGTNVVLCGPMSVEAYRATHRATNTTVGSQ